MRRQDLGAWGHNVGDSDTFADVYDQFYDAYNGGASPEAAAKGVRDELAEYFVDDDDRFDSLCALALAQWETQSLEAPLLRDVKEFIDSGADLDNWRARDASEADLKKRAAALARFLKKLQKPRPSKKRRKRQRFDFSQRTLVELPAPDGKKTFSITESYTNGEYIHTGASMMWAGGGGSIFHVRQAGLEFAGNWIDAHNLEIRIPKCVEDEIRSGHLTNLEKTGFFNDIVSLHCKFI